MAWILPWPSSAVSPPKTGDSVPSKFLAGYPHPLLETIATARFPFILALILTAGVLTYIPANPDPRVASILLQNLKSNRRTYRVSGAQDAGPAGPEMVPMPTRGQSLPIHEQIQSWGRGGGDRASL